MLEFYTELISKYLKKVSFSKFNKPRNGCWEPWSSQMESEQKEIKKNNKGAELKLALNRESRQGEELCL